MPDDLPIPPEPTGYATVNPFLIAGNADGLIDFVKRVFGANERPEARTLDHDGLLLHAEPRIGNATVMFGERKPGWTFTPGLLQVYVTDLDATLKVARQLGASVVTKPTDFFGDTFARFRDPWSNLWWVYRHAGASWSDDDGGAEGADPDTTSDAAEWTPASPELSYLHDTLVTAMEQLEDPQQTP